MLWWFKRRKKFLSKFAPVVILSLAVILAGLALFGDDSYVTLKALQTELDRQRIENDYAQAYVKSLKRDVVGIKNNNRLLEKTARNELGMQADNEMIIIFDKNQ